MPSSHPQPILPKPTSGDMFGRYSNSANDNLPGQEFSATRMPEQAQHAMPSASPSYGNQPLGRMGSAEMLSKYGGSQGGYPRANPPPFPGPIHARHTPSPNVTLGSPLRNVPDGTAPSVGMPNFGQDSPTSTGSMSNYPASKLVPPFGMAANQMSASSGNIPSASAGGPAAAAAAAAMEAASSGARFPNATQVSGPPYVSPQEMMMASKASESANPSGMSPIMALGSMMGNVQTGHVSSPSVNDLPTAEDVEAMIESMRAGERSLPTDNGEQATSQGSAPPSVGSTQATMEMSPIQPPGSTASAQNSNSENQPQKSNSNLDMPAVGKGDTSGSPPTSPLSTFSGLSPVVSPSGVSITSSFDDAEIDLDAINPSLPNNSSISMSSYHFPSSRQNQQQYEKFSKLYHLSDEPERKEFLDKYQAFMISQGTQITQVPVLLRQPLDLFKFFTAVKERGGVQEVVRRKLWQEVLEALNLPAEISSLENVLRNQYSRYLLSYEMKHTKANSLDDIKINLLEGSGIPPPNATVTCSEAIIPTSSLTQSQRPADASSVVHGSYGSMKVEPHAGLPPSYNARDGYAEAGFENSSNLFHDLRDNPGNFHPNQSTPSNTFGMPQYPYSGENRRHSVPNLSQSALPSYGMPQRNMYPGQSSMSPFFQQSSPQTGHPPAANYHHSQYQQRASPSFIGPPSSPHAVMPNTSPQDKMHSLWGSQYSPSTEPEHMVDYPPGVHNVRGPRLPSSHQAQYTPAPPYGSYPGRQQSQYSLATPPYRPGPSPSPSPRQPPMAQSMQAMQKTKYQQQLQSQQQQQQQQSQAHSAAMKRDTLFPHDCVEATRPVFTKKRKLTSRDLGPVDAWRVMMSLKSGLLSEATWALDTLNILLYDDSTVTYFMLTQLPGLLDNLIDHFRRYLIEIFDTLAESEISLGVEVVLQSREEESAKRISAEECQLKIEEINRNARRSFTSVLVGSTFEFSKEGFQSGASDWLMGGGDATVHIQTHMGAMPGDDLITSSKMKREKEIDDETPVKNETYDAKFSELSKVNEKSVTFCEDLFYSGIKECRTDYGEESVATFPAFKEDPDSNSEVAVKMEESPTKAVGSKKSEDTKSEELFTTRLKKELDLDFDSETEDSESDRYIQTEVVSKINLKRDPIIEEQSCGKEDAPLCLRTETQDAVSRRCLCVSNILRGLSFVPGNDAEMSRHAGLLLIVGRLLLLHHKHAKRVSYRHSYLQDEIELECPSDDRQDWWWYCLEGLRENALVVTSNIAGQLDLSLYPEAISVPLLDGLLHWFVCPSAAAQDPMPTATPGTSLSPRQLSLEALAKLSILESNVDLVLSSPPFTRVEELFAMLVRLVGERGNPVTRELALVLLSNLAQGENSFVGFGDSKACISMLLEFIEDAATSMSAYSSGSGLAQAGFHSENFCGTSVDMLRRAASTLVCLARIRSNRALFLPFQQRVLRLAIMQILDNMVTGQLAEILFYLSR